MKDAVKIRPKRNLGHLMSSVGWGVGGFVGAGEATLTRLEQGKQRRAPDIGAVCDMQVTIPEPVDLTVVVAATKCHCIGWPQCLLLYVLDRRYSDGEMRDLDSVDQSILLMPPVLTFAKFVWRPGFLRSTGYVVPKTWLYQRHPFLTPNEGSGTNTTNW